MASYPDGGLGKKPPSKFHPKWLGPFRVVNISDNGNRYSLQNFIDGKIKDYHITDLKLFYHTKDITDVELYESALRDHIHEFPVEMVLEHRTINQGEHTRVRSSDLEFKIRWRGFSSRWDTWEPYKNVRLNEVVIEYMRTNGLARFIPRNLEVERVNTVVTFNLEGEEKEEYDKEQKKRQEKSYMLGKHKHSTLRWKKHQGSGCWIPSEILEG